MSCKPTEKSVIGTYSRYYDFENNSKLILNKDQSFKLEIQEGLLFFHTEGNWTIENRKLILNSHVDSSLYLNSVIVDKVTIDKPGVTLKIKDKEDELPGVSIYLYDAGQVYEYSTDIKGETYINKEKWDSIKVDYVGFNPLTIKRGQENLYNIRLNPSDPIGVKLIDERWNIKNKKILDPRFKEYKRKNMYKKNAR